MPEEMAKSHQIQHLNDPAQCDKRLAIQIELLTAKEATK